MTTDEWINIIGEAVSTGARKQIITVRNWANIGPDTVDIGTLTLSFHYSQLISDLPKYSLYIQ